MQPCASREPAQELFGAADGLAVLMMGVVFFGRHGKENRGVLRRVGMPQPETENRRAEAGKS